MCDQGVRKGFIPLAGYQEYPEPEMRERSRQCAAELQRRRTVRQFSDRPVPRDIIEACLEAADTAPTMNSVPPVDIIANMPFVY